MKSKHAKATQKLMLSRRDLLVWTTPIVVSIAIPAHAQTSEVDPPPPPPPAMCISAPVLTASVASKCSGDPPVGQAVLTITSDAADMDDSVIEIRDIVVSGAESSDMFSFTSLPINVTDTVGADIEWSGNASDAVTCLPLSNITIEVRYGCANVTEDMAAEFSLTSILSDAI